RGGGVRTAVSGLDMRSVASLDDALRILRDERRTPVAGATDLYVALNFGTLEQKRFLDIWAVDELRAISERGDMLVFGALATYTSLIQSPLVRERLPMLIEAARQVGGVQIQNRGTVGGNIANGSPAGDSLPVLAAVDAVVVLRSADGERRVPFTQYYTGYRTTVMRPDELIVTIEIPPVEGKQWFRKVGTRAAQAISKIVMAGVRSSTPRIALGSVAPTVVRVPLTERALASGAGIDQGVRVLADEIKPIDDVRSSAEYRLQVAKNLLRRFWLETA
ncbi:MAG TPA: FAD binding domain-containing protein, partial [Vicinamibacterales bacterium]|nr:FAD binding domain-containing protein [Vicinamibacterales bacterium]